MATRSKKIIAVFGSNAPWSLPLGNELGTQIAKGDHILLTGGKGDLSRFKYKVETVKEQAILGAAAESGPWVGVDQDLNRREFTPWGTGVIIDTDLGDVRNCLEACLCDGAIALAGGNGTTSEAACCLWLGKPVVLIGDEWEKKYQADTGPLNFSRMVKDAFVRLGGSISSLHAPLDRMFDEQAMLAAAPTGAYTWHASPAHKAAHSGLAAQALSWLIPQLASSPAGEFAPIPRYASEIGQYDSWIQEA